MGLVFLRPAMSWSVALMTAVVPVVTAVSISSANPGHVFSFPGVVIPFVTLMRTVRPASWIVGHVAGTGPVSLCFMRLAIPAYPIAGAVVARTVMLGSVYSPLVPGPSVVLTGVGAFVASAWVTRSFALRGYASARQCAVARNVVMTAAGGAAESARFISGAREEPVSTAHGVVMVTAQEMNPAGIVLRIVMPVVGTVFASPGTRRVA